MVPKAAAKPAAAAAKPAAKAVAKPVAKPAAKHVAAPVAKPVAAPADALSGTRKCVHSRAYKKAASNAKLAGLSPRSVSKQACEAGRLAAEQWDKDHA